MQYKKIYKKKEETLGEWAKRTKEEDVKKKALEQQIVPEATRVSTPESSAIRIAVAKGRTDYNKKANIYLRQSDRDR